jgi:hypothetical protein
MNHQNSKYKQKIWQTSDRFLEMRSRWFTLIGEHLEDDRGQTLEYWRLEKADSAIILPLKEQQILIPVPTYRPGVGFLTLDLPGGRVPQGKQAPEVAPLILQRELGIPEQAIVQLTPLNPSEGWAVNSSFSNQKLYGFVAEIEPTAPVDPELLGETYPATQSGVEDLLKELSCLQCRSILLEWWFRRATMP